jgi:hypothetical protein
VRTAIAASLETLAAGDAYLAISALAAVMVEAGLAVEGTTVVLALTATHTATASADHSSSASAGVEFIYESANASDAVAWLREVVAGDPRVLTIPAEDRTLTIDPQERTLTISVTN